MNCSVDFGIVGMPVAVSAFAGAVAHERIEVEDTAVAVLRFAGGALGVIEGSTAPWPGYARRIEIGGDAGSVALEDDRIVRWAFRETAPGDESVVREFEAHRELQSGASGPQKTGNRGHELQVQDLVDAVATGRPPEIDGREARKAVAIVRAIYRSAETGQAVAIDAGCELAKSA